MVNEQANIKVTLNSAEAQKQLEDLQSEMRRLIELKKKAADAGDLKGYKKLDAELKKVSRSANQLIKEHKNLDLVLKNISGASMKELRDAERALVTQTEKLTRSTQEYANKRKNLQLVRDEISKINRETHHQMSLWNKFGIWTNRFQAAAAAIIATAAGIGLAVKSAVNAFAEFDDKISDVRKTTQLSKDEALKLSKAISEIETRTSQVDLLNLAYIGGKLGKRGEEELLGFVRASDKIAVALASDLGDNVEGAIRSIGKLIDIFQLDKEFGIEKAILKVGSAINALGATGTARESYMVEFAKRVAGIAPSVGISIQNVLGLAATLDQLGQTAEVSGTVVNNIYSRMAKDLPTYAGVAGMSVEHFTRLMKKNGNEAFIAVLEGAKKSGSGFVELANNLDALGLDGARATGVLAVLANNIDMLRERQDYTNVEFAKAISIQQEFYTKMDNAQAKLEQAGKAFKIMQVELGQRLAPAYTSVIHKATFMIRALGILAEFLFNHRKAIGYTTLALVSYYTAVKVSTFWTSAFGKQSLAAVAIQKLQVFWTTTQTAVTALLSAGFLLLTGNITLATIQFRVFTTAIKANPIGLLVSALVVGVTLLYNWAQRTGALGKTLTWFGEIIIDVRNYFASLYNESTIVRLAVHAFFTNIKVGFIVLKTFIQLLGTIIKFFVAFSQAIWNVSFTGMRDAYINLQKDLIKNFTQNGKDAAEAWASAYKKTIDGKVILKTKKSEYLPNGPVMSAQNKTIGDVITNQEGLGQYLKPPDIIYNKFPQKVFPKRIPDQDAEPLPTGDGSPKGSGKTKAELLQEEKDKEFKILETALEDSNLLEMNMLKQHLLSKQITEEQFRQQTYAQELAHLVAMNELRAEFYGHSQEDRGKELDKNLEINKYFQEQENEATKLNAEIKADSEKALQAMFEGIDKDIADSQKQTADKITESGERIIDNIDERIKAAEDLRIVQVENAAQEGADAVENAETVEEAGKAVLNSIRKQIMAHISESIAISMAKAMKSVPFPFNIIAAGVAGGAASFLMNKLIPKFATGNYPDMEFAGTPNTGMYGSRPQLGIFNEVPGQPEMVVDGITTRKLMLNYPDIVKAIYSVRDGRTPQYAEGKYPASLNSPPPGGVAVGRGGSDRGGEITPEEARALTAAINRLSEVDLTIAVETYEKKRNAFNDIQQKRNL